MTALLCDVGLAFVAWRFGVGSDFAVFWRAVRGNAYAPSAQPFGNPPTALLLLQPLRLAPFWPALALFSAGGLLLFWTTARRLYGSAAALALASPAVVQTLVAGQLSLFVAAAVFAAFLAPPLAAGALLAVAACLKPQMAFLAPALLVAARRWESLAGFALAGLTLTCLATMAFGAAVWPAWFDGARTLLSVAEARGALALAVSPATYGLPLPLAAAAAALALYAGRRLPDPHQAALLVACSLFSAPYALSYDLAAVAPLAALLALHGSLGGAVAFTAALGPLSLAGLLYGTLKVLVSPAAKVRLLAERSVFQPRSWSSDESRLSDVGERAVLLEPKTVNSSTLTGVGKTNATH